MTPHTEYCPTHIQPVRFDYVKSDNDNLLYAAQREVAQEMAHQQAA